MGISLKIGAAAGAIALLVSSAAGATTRIVSFEGTITQGIDEVGFFGMPGNLAGERVVERFSYDYDASGDLVPGVLDAITEWSDATVTVRGITWEVPYYPGIRFKSAVARPGELEFSQVSTGEGVPFESDGVGSDAFSPTFLPDLHFSANSVVAASGIGGFSHRIYSCDPLNIICSFNMQVNGSFDVDLVRFTVPEPSTWALSILGFVTVGAGLRRRGLTPFEYTA